MCVCGGGGRGECKGYSRGKSKWGTRQGLELVVAPAKHRGKGRPWGGGGKGLGCLDVRDPPHTKRISRRGKGRPWGGGKELHTWNRWILIRYELDRG